MNLKIFIEHPDLESLTTSCIIEAPSPLLGVLASNQWLRTARLPAGQASWL